MKIAIVDSGISPGHPHVGHVDGGIGIVTEDFIDRLGHGTAVAAAIREKAPTAALYAVKIFDRRLSASIEAILQGLRWCVEQRMDVVNLSLGIRNPLHREALSRMIQGMDIPGKSISGNAISGKPISGKAGPIVVAPENLMTSAIAVVPDAGCPRDAYLYRAGIFYASPYPPPIPGVPAERNLQGASFAVANMTGFVARTLLDVSPDALLATLIARAGNNP